MIKDHRLIVGIALTLLIVGPQSAFGDLQVVSSMAVQGGGFSRTNTETMKIHQNSMRADVSPGMSVIVFSDKPEQIQLFHFNKTYQKFATGGSTNSDPGTVQFSRNFQNTNLDGRPAKLYDWTNGSGHGRLWTMPRAQFSPAPGAFPGGTDPASKLNVGSLFDSNSVVVCVESSETLVVSEPSGANATNAAFTITKRLISITETNLDPAEFQIPPDYTNQVATARPNNLFLDRISGVQGNLQELQKGFASGRPVLATPSK